MGDLADIFSESLDDNAAVPEPSQQPEQSDDGGDQGAQDAAQATGADDQGTPPDPGEPETVPASVLAAVRRDFQNKVSDLEARLNAVTQGQQTQADEPDPITEDDLDDPSRLVSKIEQRFDRRLQTYRYTSSEEFARSQFDDYEDVMRNYSQVAQAVPGLAEEVDKAALPAVAAYRKVKQHMEHQQASDPAVQEKKLQAEVERRVAKAVEELRASLGDAIPKGLAQAPGATGAATPAGQPWGGRTPLEKVLGR